MKILATAAETIRQNQVLCVDDGIARLAKATDAMGDTLNTIMEGIEMAKLNVWEYVAIELDENGDPVKVMDSDFVIAETEDKAKIKAARKQDTKMDEDEFEVIVRPFLS